jgi:hypothetical protein
VLLGGSANIGHHPNDSSDPFVTIGSSSSRANDGASPVKAVVI